MNNKNHAFDTASINELVECDLYHEANEYLNLGWILISTHISGNEDQTTIYCLGWPIIAGKSKHPQRNIEPFDF